MDRDEIKRLRKTLKLTQVQFAYELGVDPITVSRWERGKPGGQDPQKANLEKLEELQKRLGVGV